jgi:hypothetical protein
MRQYERQSANDTGEGELSKRAILAVTFVAALAAFMVVQGAGARTDATSASAAASGCQLNSAKGNIKHVIYIQFDNTHYRRDNASVPSDLEQMPHLLNFMTSNGTLLTNDHTVLISHTAGGILSSLTGVYPDRHGQIVSNSNVRFNGAGFQFPSSFGYWTDPVTATTTVPNMVTPTGQNAPAPWVPYTSAGCNFGAVATANTVLENTGIGPSGDMTSVFGSTSPQWNEAKTDAASSDPKVKATPQADFVGFAVHCAQGATLCANGENDNLPGEPGGYTNYKALFGAQQLNPILTGGSGPMNDLAGQPIVDPLGNPGFPGFDGMYASTSLAYVAAMQEHGVPVTYAYISDAHDFHGVAGNQHVAFGPGSPGYVAQLKSYDDAFAAFFQRLASDGITKANTLFVFTVDEGDHFVGVQKTGCDGVTVPCVYGTNQVGEINANIDTLFNEQAPGVSVSGHRADGSPIFNFTVHGDDAPTFYLSGNPDPASTAVRNFERAAAGLTAVNPYTTNTDTLMKAMADREEMKTLHMFTSGDPLRDPTFAYFADPNYFLTDFPTSTCKTCINPLFAWNHGDIQPEIANTWLGFVGPGVQQNGIDSQVWSDHVDVAPTIDRLLGLTPNWQSDGRVLVEALDGSAVPLSLRSHRGAFVKLADAYKQLNAPFGSFGMDTLTASTKAMQTGSATSDSTYANFDTDLATLRAQRDTLAAQISAVLNGAAFQGQILNEHQAKSLIDQAQRVIDQAASLAAP